MDQFLGGRSDEDTLGKLFEPFFTTKFTGRGLGLAAIQGIVRSHGGTIKVHTLVGKGTVFHLMFPASERVARQATGVSGGELEEHWKGTGTVLLVDDEQTIRTVVRRMLERDGFTVIEAADGRDAIEVFREHADEIRVVLLDMAMPHMGGEETFQELKKISPDVQVILSSGYTEEDVAARFIGMGLAGFIHKPYTHSHLIAKLQEVLEPK